MAEPKENEQLQQQLSELVNGLQTVQVQVVDRVEPLVENTRPIWSDPLWQFLGLVLLTVIVLLIIFWLLRLLGNVLLAFAEGSNNLIANGLKSIFRFLGKQLKRKDEDSQEIEPSRASFWFNNARIKQAFDAVRYLTTRRDWRYQTSWYLLTGSGDSAKDSWIKNIHQGRRTQLLARERQLVSEGSGWYFFDHGLVIDVEDDKNFSQAVDLINTYRPERPLDGVILTISAKDLIDYQGNSAKLREYGQDLYQKMWTIQKLPVLFCPFILCLPNVMRYRVLMHFGHHGVKSLLMKCLVGQTQHVLILRFLSVGLKMHFHRLLRIFAKRNYKLLPVVMKLPISIALCCLTLS